MRLKHTLVLLVILAAIGALLVWAFIDRRKELATEQERERPIKPRSRVSTQDSESVITLDTDSQIKSGIASAPVQPISRREELRAYGTVLQSQDFIALYNSYVTAKAQVEKTRASLEASRKEYKRERELRKDQIVSDRVFQASEATWKADEANARAAEESLRALEDSARQRWGSVLAKWLFNASPAFNRLFQQQDVLIQITLPSDARILSAPVAARVQATDGTIASAKLISPSPRTDPRIQGRSFFYLAHAQTTGLLPGANVLAYLPVGAEVQEVVVPDSGVVWWQGKYWVYVQKDPEHFVRREISTQGPGKEGWFVRKGLSAGDRIVVRGTQLLLSEEFRGLIQTGEGAAKK